MNTSSENTPKSPKDYHVKLVERRDVRDFIEKHHYSHNINGLISDYCFAMYDKENNMVGAMIYGKMAMANQWRKYAVNENSDHNSVIELRRLVLVDDTPRNSESYFIAKTLKWLKKNTNVEVIVSYADPNYGHEGIVYKASNFSYLGKTSAGKVIMYRGKKYHDKAIRAKHNGEFKPFAVELRQALENGEAEYVKQVPKNIYVYYLYDNAKNANTKQQQKEKIRNK